MVFDEVKQRWLVLIVEVNKRGHIAARYVPAIEAQKMKLVRWYCNTSTIVMGAGCCHAIPRCSVHQQGSDCSAAAAWQE